MKINIRIMYLYLFSFVGLLIVVIGSINIINLGIKTFIFKDADRYEIYEPFRPAEPEEEGAKTLTPEEVKERQNREINRQRQREFSNAVSMLLVGTPLYLYHWKTIKKEDVKDKK